MTTKQIKEFVFSAYDKFFQFPIKDNRLFLSIYIGFCPLKVL